MANFGYISKLEKMVSFWVVVCAVRKNNWNFYLCLNLWLTCTVWIGVPIFWQLMRSWLFPTVFRRQNVPDQKPKSHVPYTSPGDRVTSCPVARCSPVRSLHSLLGFLFWLSAFSSGLWPHIFAHSPSLVPHSSLLLYPFSPCRSLFVCSALAIFRSVAYK